MEEIVGQLVRQIQNKYYGKYRGFVSDNRDPEKRARVKLTVPALLGEEETNWALPCLPFGGLADQGLFSVPEIGAQVWVEFEGGELDFPIWTGTFWPQEGQAPAEVLDPPTTRVFKTRAGHYWLLEDAENSRRLHCQHSDGASLSMDESGGLSITDANGGTVVLDAEAGNIRVEDTNGNTLTMSSTGTVIEDSNGNRIEMGGGGVTVKGARVIVEGSQVLLGGAGGEPLIKGQSFLTLFATHVHTSGGPGSPTSPPIPQGEFGTLSMKVQST